MAENRAAFSLRRRRSLGFSKCRWLRTTLSVPSRSIFFFNRRSAFSTDSPFFSLISVKLSHFLSETAGTGGLHGAPVRFGRAKESIFARRNVNRQKRPAASLQADTACSANATSLLSPPVQPIVGNGIAQPTRHSHRRTDRRAQSETLHEAPRHQQYAVAGPGRRRSGALQAADSRAHDRDARRPAAEDHQSPRNVLPGVRAGVRDHPRLRPL